VPARREEEFVDEEPGEAGRIVADDPVFFKEIVEQELDLELNEPIGVHHDRFCALSTITPRHFGSDRLTIGDNPIDDAFTHVLLDGAQMLTESVLSGFARLRHQIGNIDPRGLGSRNGVGDFRDQKIRNDAGVKRAGAHEDEVSILKCFNGFWKRTDATRHELDLADGHAATGDFRFAADALAIGECCSEVHIGNRRWEDAAAGGEDFAGDVNGFGKIAGDVGERGEKQVAEIVADKSAAGVKAILKQASEQSFVFRESDHAVANVARRQHSVFAAKPAGAAAIVGDSDNRGEVRDGAFTGSVAVRAADDMLFQTAEQRGKACSAAERDHTQSAGLQRVLTSRLFHVRLSFRMIRAGRRSTSQGTIRCNRPFQDTAIR